MRTTDRREQDRLRTRAAILDAVEALMREEGYAAVTSRRVAERAKLKSQLVHYHFASMDDLFQEAFRRSDQRFFADHLKALTSANPLAGIWRVGSDPHGMDVVAEYVSAANHRKVLQQELMQSWAKFRMLYRTMIAKHMEDNGLDGQEYSPAVLAFVLTSIGRSLTEEINLGFTEDHDEVRRFVENLIARFGVPSEVAKPKRARSARPPKP